jgi:hypothetical protein
VTNVSLWVWILCGHLAVGLCFALACSRTVQRHNKEHPTTDEAFLRRQWILVVGLTVLWPLLIVAFLSLEFSLTRRILSRITNISEVELPPPAGAGSLDTLPEGPRWWRYMATRLAHYQPVLLLITVAINIATDRSTGTQRAFLLPATLVAWTVVMVSLLADGYHVRRLCYRCAAATPLDGKTEADRQARWLRFFHWWSTHRYWYLVFWGITGAVAFSTGLGTWAFYPFYLFWAAISFSALRHRPLEPWCPQCNWGEGGEGEGVPVPPPVPTNQASR